MQYSIDAIIVAPDNLPTPWPGRCAALMLGALLLVVVFLTLRQIPVPDGDAQWWGPVIVNQANGEGLHGEFCPPVDSHDPQGQGRYLWHGFTGVMVFAQLLSLVPGRATSAEALVLAGAINGLVLIAAWWWWRQIAWRCGGLGWPAALLICSGLLALATQLVGWGLRPEPIITLFVLAGLIAMSAIDSRWRWLPAGLALGFIGMGHPVAGLILALMYGAYTSAHDPWPHALQRIGAAAATAIVAAVALFIFWFPFSLQDWLWGLEANSRHAVLMTGTDSLTLNWQIYCWFKQPSAFGLGIPVLASLVVGVVWLIRFRHGRPLLSWLCIGVSVVALAYFLRDPIRVYNVLPLMPMIIAGLIASLPRLAPVRPWRLALPVAVSFVIMGVGLAYYVAAACWTWKQTPTLAQARAALARLAPSESDPITVTSLFWCLGENHRVIRIWPDEPDEPNTTWVMIQQANRGLREPPAVQGYTLVEDYFNHGRPHLFGVPLSNTYGGYGYAIYRRD